MERLLAASGRATRLPVVHTLMREDAHRVDALLDIGGEDVLGDGARELRSRASTRPCGRARAAASSSAGTAPRAQVDGVREGGGRAGVEHVVRLRQRRAAPGAGPGGGRPRPTRGTWRSGSSRSSARGHRGGLVVLQGNHHRGRGRHARPGGRARLRRRRTTTPTPRRCWCPTRRCTRSGWLDDLEQRLGKPVLTANQVSVWEGLRLVGDSGPRPGLGALFAAPEDDGAHMSELGELEPVARQSTAELIADQMRSAIMYGVFAPGTQLGEAELAARFGVSRGPLREAMQRLVQEGLLRGERHRGLFVHRPRRRRTSATSTSPGSADRAGGVPADHARQPGRGRGAAGGGARQRW